MACNCVGDTVFAEELQRSLDGGDSTSPLRSLRELKMRPASAADLRASAPVEPPAAVKPPAVEPPAGRSVPQPSKFLRIASAFESAPARAHDAGALGPDEATERKVATWPGLAPPRPSASPAPQPGGQ